MESARFAEPHSWGFPYPLLVGGPLRYPSRGRTGRKASPEFPVSPAHLNVSSLMGVGSWACKDLSVRTPRSNVACCSLFGLNGIDTLSEMFTVNSTGVEDCAEGTGEAERGWAATKLRSSCASRDVGMGGGGFTGIVSLVTDEFNVDGASKVADMRGGAPAGGSSSRILESGWEASAGAIIPEDNRIDGSGGFISEAGAALPQVSGNAMPPWFCAEWQAVNPCPARGPSDIHRAIPRPFNLLYSPTLPPNRIATLVARAQHGQHPATALLADSFFAASWSFAAAPSRRDRMNLQASHFDMAISALW